MRHDLTLEMGGAGGEFSPRGAARRRTSAHSGGGAAGESHQLVAAVRAVIGRCAVRGRRRLRPATDLLPGPPPPAPRRRCRVAARGVWGAARVAPLAERYLLLREPRADGGLPLALDAERHRAHGAEE